MTKYILEEMRRVTNLRKNISEKNLKQARMLIEDAKENIGNVQKTLEEFTYFIEKESERLYKKIIMQKIAKQVVDALHYAINVLKDELIAHKQNLAIAKNNSIKIE
jgi:hypothetical protein